MDETDLAVFREMFSGRVYRLGGFDPRISATSIARILGLSHNTVNSRIRSWTRTGFLNGYAAFPNPSLLGLNLFGQLIDSRSVLAREALLDRIPSIPGIAFVWQLGEGSIWIAYLGRGPENAAQGASILRRVHKTRITIGQHPFPMPECDVHLGATDWRVIQGVRASPEVRPRAIANQLGMSHRNFRRHFDRLIDHKALLYLPRIDHSKTGGAFASIDVALVKRSDASRVWSAVGQLKKVVLPVAKWGEDPMIWDLVPNHPDLNNALNFFVVLDSAAELAQISRTLEAIDGVRDVMCEFPASMRDIPGSFDSAIIDFLRGPGSGG